MDDLTELRPVEMVFLDPDRLEVLCDRLGYAAAEAAISMAMEDVAHALQTADQSRQAGNFDLLATEAQKIGRAAGVIGLPPLVQVASDVEVLCARGDGVALQAVALRMRRLGEAALFAMWDLQDMRL